MSATARQADPGIFTAPYRLVTLAIVAMVSIFAFEEMAISTAMPVAGAELGAGRGYGLAFTVLITVQVLGTVLAGPWTDRSGPMPAILVGLGIFAAGAGLCAASNAYPEFLAGRALEGLGTGLTVVALYVVVGRFYPGALRPRVFTYVSAAWVLPSLVGPPISAWLTTSWSWRWVFGAVFVPALASALVVAAQRHRIGTRSPEGGLVGEEDGPAGQEVEPAAGGRSRGRVALVGAAIAASAGVVQAGTADLSRVVSSAGAAVAVGALALVLTAPRALTPGALRLRRGLPSVMATRLLLMAAFNGVASFVPLMLTSQRGLSVGVAGGVLALASFGWTTGAWVQGRDRWHGRRWRLVVAGGVSLTVAVAGSTAVAAAGLAWWWLAVAQAFAGLGMGLATASTGVLSLELAPVSEHGAASSSLQLSDALGSIVGISIASGVYAVLHVGPGQDGGLYVTMWAALTAVAVLAVVAARRIAT